MPSVGVRIEGLAELKRKLLALPDAIQRVALRETVKAGSAVVANAVRLRAPESIARTVKIDFEEGLRSRGAKRDKSIANVKVTHPIAHLLEYGPRPHTIHPKDLSGGVLVTEEGEFIGKVAKHPGMRARPFFRPA